LNDVRELKQRDGALQPDQRGEIKREKGEQSNAGEGGGLRKASKMKKRSTIKEKHSPGYYDSLWLGVATGEKAATLNSSAFRFRNGGKNCSTKKNSGEFKTQQEGRIIQENKEKKKRCLSSPKKEGNALNKVQKKKKQKREKREDTKKRGRAVGQKIGQKKGRTRTTRLLTGKKRGEKNSGWKGRAQPQNRG